MKIIIIPILTILIYQNIAGKNKTLDRYYVPHENWMETASIISQIFPSGSISIYNTHSTSNLLKYLPQDYVLDNGFLEKKFTKGQQIIIDSEFRRENNFDEYNQSDKGLSLRVSQKRGDFQLVSFEPGIDIPDKHIKYPISAQCIIDDVDSPLSRLNSCSNYVDNQVIYIDLQGLGKIYSLNIQGTGLTVDNLASINAVKGGEVEILDLECAKTIFVEGREWKRHPRKFESLLSLSLREKNYDGLMISFLPLKYQYKYFVKSIWYL